MPATARERLVPFLRQPRCARELRELTRMHKKTVESTLRRMTKEGWTICVTPQARQARLYQLTYFGHLLLAELTGPGDSESSDAAAPPPESLEVRAWVQAGRYRRLVLKHLTEPMTARALRRRILVVYQAIGSNHVHATLRELRRRGLVQHSDGLWHRTLSGDFVRGGPD